MSNSKTTMVAHKTHSYSKHDIIAYLTPFFGLADPEKAHLYSDSHAQNLHFPDAFVGSNSHLRETMTNLVLADQQDFMTSKCLPWRAVEGVEVQWDQLKFDVRLLNQVPYEGVSRMQTHLRRSFRERVVRRGVGMQIESDFFLTEAGRQHFKDHLMSIRMAVQETANFDGLFAYLSCPNYPFHYALSHGLINTRSAIAAVRHDLGMFGVVQKEQRGFDRAVETARTRMQSYHASPDTLIIPPELALYITTVPDARIDYAKAGQPGVDEFQRGAVRFGETQFRGLDVNKVLPFDVGEQGARTQMLSRIVQTGEFFRMGVTDTAIHIYDEDTDNIIRIEKTNIPIFGELNGTTQVDAESGDELLIIRPFIEHVMLSAVMTKAGPDTGLTLFGPSDMQISTHTASKMIEGHYTCHTKSVVTKPENVCILENVMYNGYNGGGGVKFFKKQEDLTKRLDGTTTGIVPSLIAIKVTQASDYLDLQGMKLPWSLDMDRSTLPGEGAAGFNKLKTALAGAEVYSGNDIEAARTQAFMTNGARVNSACFVGSHRIEGAKSGAARGKMRHVVGQGHHGGDSLPGDARVRRGEAVDLISARAAIRTDDLFLKQ